MVDETKPSDSTRFQPPEAPVDPNQYLGQEWSARFAGSPATDGSMSTAPAQTTRTGAPAEIRADLKPTYDFSTDGLNRVSSPADLLDSLNSQFDIVFRQGTEADAQKLIMSRASGLIDLYRDQKNGRSKAQELYGSRMHAWEPEDINIFVEHLIARGLVSEDQGKQLRDTALGDQKPK